MPMSKVFAEEVAKTIVNEVGHELAMKLMDRLVDLAIIKKAPYSPKESIVRVRTAVLNLMATRPRSVGRG